MKLKLAAVGVMILSVLMPAAAHQLDEYLQATILSVDKNGLKADMFLTPGVAVLSMVLKGIDSDGDGVISPAESRAYAEQVLRDLSLTLDGTPLTPRLVSVEFPSIGEMKEGRGDIHLEFSTAFESSKPDHKLRVENHHQSGIAAYQVNCLVPDDPEVRVGAEYRSYSQSVYELKFTMPDRRFRSLHLGWLLMIASSLGAVAIFRLILRNAHPGCRLARVRPNARVA